MSGFMTPLEKVQRLFSELKAMEDKINGNKPVPLKDLHKLHADIKKLRAQIAKLEGRVLR